MTRGIIKRQPPPVTRGSPVRNSLPSRGMKGLEASRADAAHRRTQPSDQTSPRGRPLPEFKIAYRETLRAFSVAIQEPSGLLMAPGSDLYAVRLCPFVPS
jgi:hypothetical protein